MDNKIIYLLILLAIISCNSEPQLYPLPTEIKMDAEEGNHAQLRKKWLEMVHGGPQSGWQMQEVSNQEERLAYLRTLPYSNRDGSEDLAGGRIRGKWLERGSNNQAGSVMNVWYDTANDQLFAIGAGGPMFKGGLSGFSWELVNDDIRFDANVLEAFLLNAGAKRLVAFTGGSPYYSEDGGINWVKGTGFAAPADGYHIHSSVRLNDAIFVLAKKGWYNNYVLYKSTDGKKYSIVKTFTTSDGRNLAMCATNNSSSLYFIEQVNAAESKIHTLSTSATALQTKNTSSAIGFGSEGSANIQCHITGQDTTLYVFNNELNFYQSQDQGQNWEQISKLPSSPWGVGLLVVPSNKSKMLYGEVNAFRSLNDGKNWTKINEWWEYYGQVQTKLHADIMVMKEFKDANNKDVIIIGHHGGISITYDYGVTTKNISLYGLNVSQYYDVRSYPPDPTRVFAGAQDQGLQRGLIVDEAVADFYQNISGDYGHIEFTSGGEHMWTMYPGGSLSFYLNPLSQNSPNAGYEINSKRESVWIPPIAVNPHETDDIIYVAGGSTDPSSNGSHIIKVRYNNGIEVEDLPFDFSVSGGEISAIAISPLDENIWYVATTNGSFYKSTDGGVNFVLKQKMTSEAHYLYGSCILPSKTDKDVVYLSGSGYGSIAPVYMSKNGGESFQAMRNGMPSTVAFQIAANENEDIIYAATETGPYVYLKDEDKWFPLSGNTTPNQTYWSVEYIPQLATARFGTYGRGVWDFVFESTPVSSKDWAEEESAIQLWPMPVVGEVNWKSELNFDRITLYHVNGMPVKEIQVGEEKVDVSFLPEGTYFMVFSVGKKQINKKIIKL
jgi:photosystem II stability/assembly factor-like uncharacterized protein